MMKNKLIQILLNSIPILLMVGMIPFIHNDYLLTILYVVVILLSFFFKREKHEIKVLFFGFSVMIIFESIFVSTGVETFVRNSLWGIMPVWLPLLWGYSFVAIKRGIKILNI